VLEGFPDRLAAGAVTAPEEAEDLGRRLTFADRAVVIAGSSISGLVLAARLGRAALAAADKALQPVRWRNWATELSFFRGPEAARAANARMPGPLWRSFVLDWNHLRSRGGG
jgi:hypothetical protein